MAEEYIERPSPPGRRPFNRTLWVLQALLIAAVVGWVLDLYRKAGLNLYTEQMLLTVLGLGIGICFIVTSKKNHFFNLAVGAAGLALCLWLAWRYPQLSTELTSRPLDGVL